MCKQMHSNLQVKYNHAETKACGMHHFFKTVTTNLQLLNEESLGVSHSSTLLYLETKKAKEPSFPYLDLFLFNTFSVMHFIIASLELLLKKK